MFFGPYVPWYLHRGSSGSIVPRSLDLVNYAFWDPEFNSFQDLGFISSHGPIFPTTRAVSSYLVIVSKEFYMVPGLICGSQVAHREPEHQLLNVTRGHCGHLSKGFSVPHHR